MGNHKEFTTWTGTGERSYLHEWERSRGTPPTHEKLTVRPLRYYQTEVRFTARWDEKSLKRILGMVIERPGQSIRRELKCLNVYYYYMLARMIATRSRVAVTSASPFKLRIELATVIKRLSFSLLLYLSLEWKPVETGQVLKCYMFRFLLTFSAKFIVTR
jgi:hypothetical protein